MSFECKLREPVVGWERRPSLTAIFRRPASVLLLVPLIAALIVACVRDGSTSAGDSNAEPALPGLTSQVASICTARDERTPTRHRSRGDPQATTLAESLRRRVCSLDFNIAGSTTHEEEFGPTSFSFRLARAPLSQFPGIVDSNSPLYWSGDVLSVLNSAWEETYRGSGEGIDNLSEPLLVQLPSPARPGPVWLEAVWRDPANGTLYGWYHQEPSDVSCLTAPVIGAAVSFDDGLSWEDRGYVLENGYPIDCAYDNGYFVGGNGDFSVVVGPRSEYFYFVFTNYAGPLNEQGVAVARSRLADRGQPGTVVKYYRGGWTEPGIGGRATSILPSATGWKGPQVNSFWGPSVHWNGYLNLYVSLLNRTDGAGWEQEGIYISFSHDLLNWTAPERILESNDWYPQVAGFDEGTDSLAGKAMRVYVGGVSRLVLEFDQSSLP